MTTKHSSKPIYEGKAKILYPGPDSDTLIQHFKDDITAFNLKKKEKIAGKGTLNCLISELFFKRLGLIGIPNHFIKRLTMRDQLVRRLDMFPVEVVVRNIASGSMTKRFPIEEGTRLQRSIIEFYHKDDSHDDPMVSEEHITAFGWMSPQDIDDVVAITLRINDFLQGLLYGVGISLVDMKLEFGRHFDEYGDVRVLLADEISPDTMRLWDLTTQKRLDKDRFREDLPGVLQAYHEVAKRLGIPFLQNAEVTDENSDDKSSNETEQQPNDADSTN